MKPDILATPSAPSTDSGWPNHEPAPASVPLETGPVTASVDPTAFNVTASVAPALPTHAIGHAHPGANGHTHASGLGAHPGHLNGHAHRPPRSLHGHSGRATLVGGYAPALPRLDVFETPSLYLRLGKRAIDMLGSALALVVTSPLLAFAALLIKFESRGPVLYKSTRIGRGGTPFTFYKLRSMVDGADQNRHDLSHLNECDGPIFKMARDPRVTRIGRFLRTTSIDEIPQFVNVLLGEMSLVGPRPPIPEEVAQYEPWQMRRLDVRPGLTCLWQISGRSHIGFQEWMRLDLEYIKHQSLWLDAKILVRTIPAVLSREGAY
ncbi:MAG TPA: sugar transferase [Candidatus Limnocylindria bacterium]|nr:sugar transferase [Candidatus Limnocylindria bacterium]